MSDITITHTAAEGTLIDGTSRGDGSSEILKRHGWRWSRNLGTWYVPRSRDQQPKQHVIDATRGDLAGAGFDVDVEIDAQPRPTADVVTDQQERATARAERLEQVAQRETQRADSLHARAREKAGHIPFGQPILVGHHSEGRDRRFRAGIARDFDRSHEAAAAAEVAAQRADAARTTAREDGPVTVANRIRRLEAEQRRCGRFIESTTDEGRLEVLRTELATIDEHLAYWRGVREEQIRTGRTGLYNQETIAAGDAVRVSGSWWIVKRANAKSVSVHSEGLQTRTPYDNITGHRAAPKGAQQ